MDKDQQNARETARRNEQFVPKPENPWQRNQDLQNIHNRERERLDAEARKRNGW